MKNFKRILCILLAALMCFGLFSCKKDEEPVETEGTEAPPIPAVSFLDYSVIRPESSSGKLVDEIGVLYGKLMALSGTRNLYETDTLPKGQEPDPAAKEILIGATNRPESQQALTQIADDEYIITVIGNKVVITGLTDNATIMAVRYFVETYLGDGADGTLAGDLSYKAEAEILMLTENGSLKYSLVYSDDDYTGMLATNRVSSTLRALTSASVTKLTDETPEDPNAYRIVFGYTNYEATATVAETVTPEGYAIDFVGNTMVVFAWTSASLLRAADELIDLISNSYYTDANGYTTICLMKDRISSDTGDATFYKDVPFDVNGTKAQQIYDAGDNTMMLYWKNIGVDSFDAYTGKIEALGYTAYQSNENTAIKSTTYAKDDVTVHVYYMVNTSELRAVVSKGMELPVNAYSYTKVCEPALTQVECEMTEKYACGASYLIRLEDGTFIVIDGGYAREWNAKELYGLMEAQKPAGVEDIVITAWIISHPHMDHYDMYDYFSKSEYKDKVSVKMLIGQDCSDYTLSVLDDAGRGITYSKWAEKFPGCKYVKAHTGQKFYFPGVTIDMMFTHEDIYPRFLYELNNAVDTVFKVTVNGNESRDAYSFLFINDFTELGSDMVAAAWKNELKSDVVQLGHHTGGGSVALYEFADADICFCADHKVSYDGGWGLGTDAAKWAIENIPTWIKAFEGSYTFWFEEQLEFSGNGSVDAESEYTKLY